MGSLDFGPIEFHMQGAGSKAFFSIGFYQPKLSTETIRETVNTLVLEKTNIPTARLNFGLSGIFCK